MDNVRATPRLWSLLNVRVEKDLETTTSVMFVGVGSMVRVTTQNLKTGHVAESIVFVPDVELNYVGPPGKEDTDGGTAIYCSDDDEDSN